MCAILDLFARKIVACTDALNIIQSFSAKGHPYDNAVMECFFKYLKKEERVFFKDCVNLQIGVK